MFDMTKEIEKKGILPDSAMPIQEGVKDDKGGELKPAVIKRYDAAGEIKKFGLSQIEVVEYEDPFSGTIKKIMIDRRGTTDEKLAIALLDPEVTREQKDTVLSMYLFEKGKQGASMLMDLWQYKGAHTKESRQFQSTMRFDFELFLNAFQMFMRDSYDLIWKNLPLEVVEVEVKEEGEKVKKEIVQTTREVTANEIAVVLGEYARYHGMTASLIGNRIRAEVQKREKAKGKGIYIGMDNKPYSIFEDGDIIEVIKKDKDLADEEKLNREAMGERVKSGICVKCDKLAIEDKLYCEEHNV